MIGVCGYISTGSSAVLDYLKEYDKFCVMDKEEFVLPYIPDGLEDLDYHLNINCSKYMSSVMAIERFRRMLYNCYAYVVDKEKGNALVKAGEDFLNEITQVKWQGHDRIDYMLDCSRNYKKFNFNRLSYKFVSRKIAIPLSKKRGKSVNIGLHDMEFSMHPENFDEASHKLIHEFLRVMGADFSKEIVLNQPFCGNDPVKSFKFFDSPRAIVVDRDPRDQYLFSKRFLLYKAGVIPTDSVEQFVKYYRIQRQNNADDDRILRIRFEDMIYEYEGTTKVINDFCGLKAEDRKREYFVPDMSINNTQLFKRFPEHKEEIEYIEKELSEYLYPFEKYGDISPNGKMFYGRSPLNKS